MPDTQNQPGSSPERKDAPALNSSQKNDPNFKDETPDRKPEKADRPEDNNKDKTADTQAVKSPDSPKEGKDKKGRESIHGWIAAALCVLALAICVSLYLSHPARAGEEIKTSTITMTDLGFDTPVTFKTTCSEDDFNRYLEIIRSTYTECNELFDAFHRYDERVSLMEVNEEAASHPVEVDEKVIEVFNDSLKAHALNPKFDVAQGRLTFLWKQAFEAATPALPDDAAIQASINPDSMDAVVIEGNTISFTDDHVQLDFGAIAKGYTTELAAERLKEAGLEYGFLNAGGNVVLIGEKPDGEPWKVGIQNPDESDSLLLYTTRTPTCLVTSGDYQRYMMVDGRRYAHIIDPTTGYPEEWMRSVTVIHEDSAYCDAMSTALYCMPVEEGMALCEQLDLDAVWIADKGTVDRPADLQTDTFDIYLSKGLKGQVSLKEKN